MYYSVKPIAIRRFETRLNGPGKNKAELKISSELQRRGLENVVIIPRDEIHT